LSRRGATVGRASARRFRKLRSEGFKAGAVAVAGAVLVGSLTSDDERVHQVAVEVSGAGPGANTTPPPAPVVSVIATTTASTTMTMTFGDFAGGA
jgi:hypothetical protein